tara:strand:+ start:675 stop:947 length:273 start_codon:yes stop_codon:yes gene_type:complete
MKSKLILAALIFFNFNTFVLSNDLNCKEIKKFSTEYFKCKGNLLKDKTISAGQNIIKDTKNYQKKEWSEEKIKIKNAKDKIIKTKEKVLN